MTIYGGKIRRLAGVKTLAGRHFFQTQFLNPSLKPMRDDAAMIALLRNGAFLTGERVRTYPRLLLAGFVLTLGWLFFTAHGVSDYAGRPLGSDFSSFYAAGRMALAGHSPYAQPALRATEQSLFGAGAPYYSFAYPPIFLLLLAPLAKLPYLPALLLWQGASLLLYLAAMSRLRQALGENLPGGALFLTACLSFTAVFVNLIHGQNGFLAAAQLGLALSLLDEKPALAGLCFGLLIFKPQLGLVVPFALAAGGRWRSFAAAATTVLGLAALATLLFGAESWRDFLAAAHFSQAMILDHNAVGYEKMVSVFAWARLWHLPLSLSYGAQALAALSAIASLDWLWRGNADPRLKGAALVFATLLATPFALDYDLMLLAPAILLLAARREPLPYEASLAALLWLMPFAAASLAAIGLPLAVWSIAAGLIFTLRAARQPGC